VDNLTGQLTSPTLLTRSTSTQDHLKPFYLKQSIKLKALASTLHVYAVYVIHL